MTGELVAEDRQAMDGKAITKTVRLYFAGGGRFNRLLFDRGYGMVGSRIDQIQADAPTGYAKSIRAFVAPPGQTDQYLDTRKVALNGISRHGKVVMWAGAQDLCFAITFSGEAGCGGQVIVCRGYGETVRSIAAAEQDYWGDPRGSFLSALHFGVRKEP